MAMACCVTMALSGAANPPPAFSTGSEGRFGSGSEGRFGSGSEGRFGSGRVSFNASSPPTFSVPASAASLTWGTKPTNAAIIVNENESPDSIVRRFRREVMNAGVIAECRRRRFHETPQEKKKRKVQALARKKKMSRRQPFGGGFDGGATSGFQSSPQRTFVRPVDPFAPKPPKSKEEDDREFWGDEDDELILQ